MELVDSEGYDRWKRSVDRGFDLVIGAHSLSELDWTTFLRLFRERGLQVTCRVLRDAPLATQRGTRREEAQFDSAALQGRQAFPL